MFFFFFVWWVSQDFGNIFTFPFATATEPNSAPLFSLFLIPIFLESKQVLSHTLFNEVSEGNVFDRVLYSKWSFACMLVVVGILFGLVFNAPTSVLQHTSNGTEMDMMNIH